MRIRRYLLGATLLIVQALASGAAAQDGGDSAADADLVPAGAAKILKQNRLGSKSAGIYIAWADSGERIAALSLDRPFNPASAEKLLISIVALDELGAGHTWTTSLMAAAPVANGSLRGDIYLRGGGDPRLTSDKFLQLVSGLARRGITEVAGDVVIDDSAFDIPPHDPYAFDGRGTRMYNGAGGAAVVNWGATEVIIRNADGSADVILDPPSSNLIVRNQLRIVKGRCAGNWRPALRERLESKPDGSAVLSFRGSFAAGCGEKSFYVLGQRDPAAHAAGALGGSFALFGGEIGGGWRRDKAPRSARVIASVESAPLAESLRGMNKYSNNIMARNIFLSLAEAEGEEARTLEAARARIDGWFAENGIPSDGLFVDNGSGLSRESRISARQFGDALAAFHSSPQRFELISSLAVLGRDGTVRTWNRKSPTAGNAHIKTGTLSNARSAVGYVHNPAGDIIFVVLTQTRSTSHARRAIQQLLDWAYRLPAPQQG